MLALRLFVETFVGVGRDYWVPWSDKEIPVGAMAAKWAEELNADYGLRYDPDETVVKLTMQVFETDAKILKSGRAVGATEEPEAMTDPEEACYLAKDIGKVTYN